MWQTFHDVARLLFAIAVIIQGILIIRLERRITALEHQQGGSHDH